MISSSLLLFSFLIACGESEKDDAEDTSVTEEVDADGDGVTADEDCDDANADAFPGNEEVCDEIDNDCDGEIDNEASDMLTWYEDADADSYGDADVTMEACTAPEGYTDNMDDCDDSSDQAYPGGTEICDDLDNDCDGEIDNEASDMLTWYEDADEDGLGDALVSMDSCTMPEGYADNMDDCDDTDAEVGATDADEDGILECQGDCDDNDAEVGATDADEDGFISCIDDCDDNDANTFPGAADLDSEFDCMRDADDDGYGDTTIKNCWTVEMFDSWGDSWNSSAHVLADGVMYAPTSSDDCVDATVCDPEGGNSGNPEGYLAVEVCSTTEAVDIHYIAGSSFNAENSIRLTDANGNVWEFGEKFGQVAIEEDTLLATVEISDVVRGTDCDDADASIMSGDADGDGYDACNEEDPYDCNDEDAAVNPGVDEDADGFNLCLDCNDTDDTVNPDATEVYYDGVDQNCDGWSDYDWDMDGYEAASYEDASGTVVEHGGADCDDQEASYTPLLMEDATETNCYYDGDGDGYGESTLSDDEIAFGLTAGTDCYDSSSTTYPGAAFNDSTTDCMQDYDGDGYGNENPYSWYNAIPGTDCYDSNDTVYPGAAYLEAVDSDGDGVNDCTMDEDGDGYGNSDAPSYYYAVDGSDCDDEDAAVNPTVDGDGDGSSVCDDCDDADITIGSASLTGYTDYDGDGFGIGDMMMLCDLDEDGDGVADYADNGDDCYDYNDAVYPGAAYLEAVDSDGDGVNDCTMDDDGDGYGDMSPSSWYYAEPGTDCDDDDASTYPGAAYNEISPLNQECLTDADGDGFAPNVAGLYETTWDKTADGCMTILVEDSWGDGCSGAVDLYVDGTYYNSYAGPSYGYTETYDECDASGALSIGWTEPSSYNSECSFTISDAAGNELYSSGLAPVGTVPGGGTDSDDTDAAVQ